MTHCLVKFDILKLRFILLISLLNEGCEKWTHGLEERDKFFQYTKPVLFQNQQVLNRRMTMKRDDIFCAPFLL